MTKATDIYYPVSAIEKSLFNSIWSLSDYDHNTRKEIILPKGTIEIIFNTSDTINYFNPALQISKKLPVVFVNGLNFMPFELVKTGFQSFLGIQLTSIGFRLIFGMSVSELNNCILEGNYLCSGLVELADELFHKHTFSQKIEIILKWIRQRIAKKKDQFLINRALMLMDLNRCPELTVKTISKKMCLSDRQLRRFSHEWLGMSTEEFILYNKYKTTLHLMHNSEKSLTEIGFEAGYYDQSHFIREFKSFTNLTPGMYKAANKGLPGHIFI